MALSNPRLDLTVIESSLRAVQKDFDRVNQRLDSPRDPMGDEVIDGLLRGYAFLDRLQEQDVDLLARGNSRQLLQLNCLVICENPDPNFRVRASYFRETERRFYDDANPGGVRALMNHLADHTHLSAWHRAADVYIQMLSAPQLFFEGNHRTGALLMSHILLRAGKPPFVLTRHNAQAYFDPSSLIKGFGKQGIKSLFTLPRLRGRLVRLLQSSADPKYLLRDTRETPA